MEELARFLVKTMSIAQHDQSGLPTILIHIHFIGCKQFTELFLAKYTEIEITKQLE